MGKPRTTSIIFLLFLSAAIIWGLQDEVKVIQEHVFCDYQNDTMVNISEIGVYKVNRTINGVRLNFTLLQDISAFSMVYAKAYKFLSNTYRLTAIQFGAPIMVMLKTTDFDLDTLFLNYTRPQLKWPIKKGVTYKMRGWFPNSTKFPPHSPTGRWRIALNFTLNERVKIADISWYIKIEEIIRW